MQKHTKLETGDHEGGGRRRTSASPAPPVMQRISHVHLIRRGVAAAPPSPHRQRRCTISSEAGLAPTGSPAGVRIPRPPHPSRRDRRATFPASSKAMHDLIRGGPCPLGLPRGCAHPTSTSSVAAWPPRHLPRIAKGDARSHPRRALPPRAPPRVCASHVHLIRRGDFGHALRVRRAPFRRCPPQNGDEKLRPASNRCWAEFCDSSRAGAAAFPQPFLCACGHRAAFLTRPSRSCPRATPRTGCAYGRSGGRTPSSPATTAGRTR